MSSNTPSGAVSGVAYQSIIIALIAGGILTIGVVSILWRRRSQRTWAAMRADGHQHGMVPFGLGMGMGFGLGIEDETAAGRGRGRRKKLGRMPQVWDALIGPREVDDEAGEKGEVAGGERGVAVQWGKGELTGDVLQADAGEGWHVGLAIQSPHTFRIPIWLIALAASGRRIRTDRIARLYSSTRTHSDPSFTDTRPCQTPSSAGRATSIHSRNDCPHRHAISRSTYPLPSSPAA